MDTRFGTWFTYYRNKTDCPRDRVLTCNFTPEAIDSGFLVDAPHNKSRAKQYALFRNIAHFECDQQKVPEERRNFYEVIRGEQPQKLRFDIDTDSAELGAQLEEDLPLIKEKITEALLEVYGVGADDVFTIVECTSHSPDKRSWHLVIDQHYVANNAEAAAFYENVWQRVPQRHTSKDTRCIDNAVYSSLQCFRMTGSRKRGSERVKVLASQHHFEESLVTNIAGCEALPTTLTAGQKATKASCAKGEPQPSQHQQQREHTLEEARQHLERLAPERWCDRETWIKLGMILKRSLGDAALPLWKEFSEANYDRYDEEEHERQWESFDTHTDRGGATVTFGSLVHWANIDTPFDDDLTEIGNEMVLDIELVIKDIETSTIASRH